MTQEVLKLDWSSPMPLDQNSNWNYPIAYTDLARVEFLLKEMVWRIDLFDGDYRKVTNKISEIEEVKAIAEVFVYNKLKEYSAIFEETK